MEIKKAALSEAKIIAGLAIQMWDSHTVEELELDFEGHIKSGGAVFLAWNNDEATGYCKNAVIGLSELGKRARLCRVCK